MWNIKVKSHIGMGVLLAYFGLKDLENFNVFYEGIAVVFSLTSFVFAFVEYKKEDK